MEEKDFQFSEKDQKVSHHNAENFIKTINDNINITPSLEKADEINNKFNKQIYTKSAHSSDLTSVSFSQADNLSQISDDKLISSNESKLNIKNDIEFIDKTLSYFSGYENYFFKVAPEKFLEYKNTRNYLPKRRRKINEYKYKYRENCNINMAFPYYNYFDENYWNNNYNYNTIRNNIFDYSMNSINGNIFYIAYNNLFFNYPNTQFDNNSNNYNNKKEDQKINNENNNNSSDKEILNNNNKELKPKENDNDNEVEIVPINNKKNDIIDDEQDSIYIIKKRNYKNNNNHKKTIINKKKEETTITEKKYYNHKGYKDYKDYNYNNSNTRYKNNFYSYNDSMPKNRMDDSYKYKGKYRDNNYINNINGAFDKRRKNYYVENTFYKKKHHKEIFGKYY